MVMMPPAPISATVPTAYSFTVNSPGDAGDAAPDGICETAPGNRVCTLRAAIDESNAQSEANITIPSMTIVLGSQLTVNRTVTLTGAGQGSTIIDGKDAVRAFYFEARSGAHVISNMTIQNCRVTISSEPHPEPLRTGNGGAIFNAATLTLNSVTLTGSHAEQGGGIYNMLGYTHGSGGWVTPTLTLNSVSMTNNTATSTILGQGGGGMFNGGLLTAQNVTLSNNVALQGGGYYNNSYSLANLTSFRINNNTATYGGGIDNDLGNIVLSQGEINGNFANCCGVNGVSTGGGGIYNNDGLMTLTEVTISGNYAASPGGYGGGISNWKDMALDRVTVSGNSAAYGAGIYTGNYDNQPSHMTLTNASVSGNVGVSAPSVDAQAAGIWNGGSSTLLIVNSTIANNSAVVAGGIENAVLGHPFDDWPNSIVLRNTILSGNTSSAPVGWGPGWFTPDCRGVIGTQGGNIIGDATGCGFSAGAGDRANVDPLLGPLQNNGGPTETHAIPSWSPAVDGAFGGCPPPPVDQRGMARPQGPRCDIGAYEYIQSGYDHFLHIPLILRNLSAALFGAQGR
jgi:hypothetical protein